MKLLYIIYDESVHNEGQMLGFYTPNSFETKFAKFATCCEFVSMCLPFVVPINVVTFRYIMEKR